MNLLSSRMREGARLVRVDFILGGEAMTKLAAPMPCWMLAQACASRALPALSATGADALGPLETFVRAQASYCGAGQMSLSTSMRELASSSRRRP